MTPWILDGDVVELEPVQADACRPGDVLLLEARHGVLVCHRILRRILRRGRSHFLSKGDWLDAPDGLVPASACLGRVRAVCRGGRPVAWLDRQRPVARLLACGCALASALSRTWTRPARDFLALREGWRRSCA